MKNKIGLAICLFVWASGAQAANYPKAQKIVEQTCAACHGSDGNSMSPENPVLAGQIPEYLQLQLKHFKSDVRPNPVMKGMAASLTEEDMKELGAFFAEQKVKPRTSKDPKKVAAGERIYRGGNAKAGIPACMACHGPAGAGVPSQYPRLAGQHAGYVLSQLKAFKQGGRAAHKGDSLGKVMVDVAAKMSEEDMAAVAEYISALR